MEARTAFELDKMAPEEILVLDGVRARYRFSFLPKTMELVIDGDRQFVCGVVRNRCLALVYVPDRRRPPTVVDVEGTLRIRVQENCLSLIIEAENWQDEDH
jgi:hypothetical protein